MESVVYRRARPKLATLWSLCACVALAASAFAQEDFHAVYKHGQEQWDAGKYRDAQRDFNHALQLAFDRVGVDVADRLQIALSLIEADVLLGEYKPAAVAGETFRAKPAEPPVKAQLLLLLAESESGVGDYKAAREDFQASLELFKAIPGDGPQVAQCWTGLGTLDRIQGQFSEAESALKSSLTLTAGKPVESAPANIAMGDLEAARGNVLEARKFYNDSAAALGANQPSQSPLFARALLGLAELDLTTGRDQDAEAELKKANQLTKLLTSSPAYLAVQDALGRLELARGNFSAALDDLNVALEVRSDNLGPDHPSTAASLDHLGLYQLARSKLDDAEHDFQKSEQARLKTLGPNHPARAESCVHLAKIDRLRGRYPAAAQRLAEAVRIQTATLSPKAPALAETSLEQGRLADATGDSKAAESFYRAALAIDSEYLPERHPRRLETERLLGLALFANQKYAEAEPLLSRWMTMHGQELAPDQPERLNTAYALAHCLLEAHKNAEAQAALKALLDPARKSPLLASIQYDLGTATYAAGDPAGAAPLYEAAIKGLPAGAESATAYERLGHAYLARKRYPEAVDAFDHALALRKRFPSPAAQLLELRMSSGDALLWAGKLNDGELRLREWLNGRGDTPLDADEVQVTGHAAETLFAAHRYDAAEPFLRRLLASIDRRGATAGSLDKILLELAQACEGLGRNQDAASFYERLARRVMRPQPGLAEKYLLSAQQLRVKANGDDNVRLVPVLNLLAECYLAERKYPEARKTFEATQAILKKNGGDPAGLALAANGLGAVAQAQNQFDEAAADYQQAMDVLKTLNPPPAQALAAVLFSLGSLAVANNKLDEANEEYSQYLKLSGGEAPADDPLPVERLDTIAAFYIRQQRWDEARKFYERALDLRRQVYGEGSAQHAWGLYNLADLDAARKAYAEALPPANQALSMFEASAGPQSSEVSMTLDTLATIYNATGELEKALAATQRSLDILEKLGKVSPQREQMTLSGLGQSYRGLKQYPKAVEIYQRMAELWKAKGYADPNYRSAVRNLVALYELAGDHAHAQKLFDEARKAVRNSDDEVRLLKEFAGALRQQGNVKAADKLMNEAKSMEEKRARPG